ncbi:PREDICTED: endothelial lipase-like isoform X1 [Rhagoletis zephyria]|uniref:endothelial lipase-like isoform X1 n=1 Tax=Rhagoletis zephyria TaxID=28612 RepID=UPI000811390C|nr:PREDICTED: endothelial lipase-like isoform X1 [Rhagoletis zephyria]
MKGLVLIWGFLGKYKLRFFLTFQYIFHFKGTAVAYPLRVSLLDMAETPTTNKVHFYLYTASNPEEPQELSIGDVDSVKKSLFDKSRHTKVLIHGWGGNYTTSPNGLLRRAYFTQQDYNIISVDWYPYAKLNYLSARAKVPVVGENIAEFLDFLNEQFQLSFDKVVVIGHSMVAHAAGFSGKLVKRGNIAAIVSLDAASPLYDYNSPDTRISSDDAKFVLSIHTNGNLKGFLNPIGTASFYPNWGRVQPGCGLDLDGACSHSRSVTLFAEAVRGYSFAPIYGCGDFTEVSSKSGCNQSATHVEFGDPLQIDKNAGMYYFTTNAASPFGVLIERRNKASASVAEYTVDDRDV